MTPRESVQRRRLLRQLDVWARCLGARRHIRPDAIIDSIDGLEELDPYDVYFAAGERFGVPVSRGEVRAYCGMDLKLPRQQYLREYLHTWTWAGLAAFLLPKLNAVTLHEATVLGRRCGPAGAFFALRRIAVEFGLPGQFTPSDKIVSCFQGRELRKLWARLGWLTQHRLAPLRCASFIENGNLAVAGAVVIALISLCAAWPIGLLVAFGTALAGIALWATGPRLPAGIVTIRDVSQAVWVAHQHDSSVPVTIL